MTCCWSIRFEYINNKARYIYICINAFLWQEVNILDVVELKWDPKYFPMRYTFSDLEMNSNFSKIIVGIKLMSVLNRIKLVYTCIYKQTEETKIVV